MSRRGDRRKAGCHAARQIGVTPDGCPIIAAVFLEHPEKGPQLSWRCKLCGRLHFQNTRRAPHLAEGYGKGDGYVYPFCNPNRRIWLQEVDDAGPAGLRPEQCSPRHA